MSHTGIRGYGRVLGHGPAVRPFLAAVIARLPVGMAGLGMIVLIEQVRGSYSIAGVVTAAFALATALSAPVLGRLMDRAGQPRVLIATGLVSSAALASLALAAVAGAADVVLIALAIATGLTFPPISPAMRAAWRVIFPDQDRRRLGYALDASSVELIFVCGPLLLSLLAACSPPQVPLLVTAGLMASGSLAYSSTKAARSWRSADIVVLDDGASVAAVGRNTARSALTAPGLALLLLVALCMAVGFGQMDTAFVATADLVLGGPQNLGFLFAAIAGGSTIGGLVYGSRHWKGDEFRRTAIMLGLFALSIVPLPLLMLAGTPPLSLLLPLMFLTGLTIAPTLIMFQNGIDALAPGHRITEAQAFLSAAMTSGGALGTAAGGIMVDHLGPGGALVGAVVVIALGSALCFTQLRRWRGLVG
ncbi:MFS transporter [Tessaracoccus defluvii]|uniref:MFS transporter n=1 Tax=Tessaracoccus defluvii TaxID=1285901 RepID=A0A7H0H708_9ACTN|nr:MFS transporter [Tessaracoccus defluvii]QNP56324.1 MFS transporter [Tessaracoccus defluvii]